MGSCFASNLGLQPAQEQEAEAAKYPTSLIDGNLHLLIIINVLLFANYRKPLTLSQIVK